VVLVLVLVLVLEAAEGGAAPAASRTTHGYYRFI
jgi:hypothetical protein